ncbi:MurR/RpiR family transcriptional regulator [Solibacillus sp. MA9]|uniref:MurR/RpiR family transcriptional regulator n=1 Tax=Solibacillus palustris TaxID=2908203 RepID=A0ABS9UA88_9BACL|nr:MurR/RpiR family transcriptional regulator [Solibacillus sp. MA9]MCH7321242.1 MurR/RpiR family transcriptional regulator [Solibacillus sp. MA9]
MKDALTRIRMVYNHFKPAQKQVAEFILGNPQLVMNSSIKQVSLASNCSEATIVRFCKEIEFEGFKDLKMGILTSLNLQKETLQQGIHKQLLKDTNIEDSVAIISHNNQQAILDMLKLMDYEKLESAIDLLYSARSIYIAGVGASALVAQDFLLKCQRINKQCEALLDMHQMLVKSVHLTEGDVIFLITYSGETPEIIEFAKLAKEKNVPIIALTTFKFNTVQSLATINLYVSASETNERIGATSSRISQLNMIDILFTCIARKDYERSVQMFKETKAIIQREVK